MVFANETEHVGMQKLWLLNPHVPFHLTEDSVSRWRLLYSHSLFTARLAIGLDPNGLPER